MTKAEQEKVERHLQNINKEISTKQFNYLCGQAAIRGHFYDRYKKSK